jgi:hypothetical protein
MPKKPRALPTPFPVLAPGQTCRYCNRPFQDNHRITPLGAVICMHRSSNACRPSWHEHGLLTVDGQHYQSIMEQIGSLACLLEDRGPDAGYELATENIRLLVARLAGRPVCMVRPVEEWFLDTKPESGQ